MAAESCSSAKTTKMTIRSLPRALRNSSESEMNVNLLLLKRKPQRSLPKKMTKKRKLKRIRKKLKMRKMQTTSLKRTLTRKTRKRDRKVSGSA